MGKSQLLSALAAVALLHNTAEVYVTGFGIGFRRPRIAKRVEGSALLGTSCPPAPLETQKEQTKGERLYRIGRESGEEEESSDDSIYSTTQSEKIVISLSGEETEEGCETTPSAQSTNEECSEDENNRDEKSDKANADDAEQSSSFSDQAMPKERRDLIARAALLNRRLPNRTPPSGRADQEKRTSVGLRRAGSASKARQAPGSTSKVMDALRKAARGNAAKNAESDDKEGDKPMAQFSGTNDPCKVSQSKIQSAIGDLLHSNIVKKTSSKSAQFVTSVSNLGKSVGILGDPSEADQAVLSAPLVTSESGAMVRIATPMDDLEIANLRLSVFSDFSPSQRGQFCTRSCDAIANRRKRGAMCIIATENGGVEGSKKVYGTAEISDHEFHGTQLGKRRPRAKILYVTEVAVHPAVRRRGYGSMLFDAIDTVARQRKVETVYLHVDVCNTQAIAMYEKCGYAKVDADESVFEEFTRSLNLHPGATKGRTHHLLFKDISQATWIPQDMFVDEPKRVMGSLGFEIPA